jgi:4-carboxymuconolactone decarboxylase
MARIALPNRDSLPEALHDRWDRTASRGPVLNIQRAFFANPEIRLDAFGVWRASGLQPRARELVILRAAFRKDSRYEWHQHVRIARSEGLSDAEIRAVTDWQPFSAFSPDERALLAYVDALADAQRPTDEQFAAFSTGRTREGIVGITYLITLYFQLAQLMATLDLETEDPFVGWALNG